MGIFTPGEWEVCAGMNNGKPCNRPRVHRSHKTVFGRVYGELPPKPTRDREKKGKKR